MSRKAPLTLTPATKPFLLAIYKYQIDHGGVSPSFKELAVLASPRNSVPLSTSVVGYYLDQLNRLGYIDRTPWLARAIVITSKGYGALGLAPVVVSQCPNCGHVYDPSQVQVGHKETLKKFKNSAISQTH